MPSDSSPPSKARSAHDQLMHPVPDTPTGLGQPSQLCGILYVRALMLTPVSGTYLQFVAG